MSNESGANRPASLACHFFAVWFSVLPILIAAATLLLVVNTWAATIEQCSLRVIGDVSEVEFQMRGPVPRWRLHSDGQELWLDLERSQVGVSVEPVSAPVTSPVRHIGIHDLGGGRVRLRIRVRGEVNYLVAQMPYGLLVRIAPSARKIDLAEPLLRAMEQSRPLPLGPSTATFESPNIDRSPAVPENGGRISPGAAGIVNQTAPAGSAIGDPGRGPLTNLPAAYTIAPTYSNQTPRQITPPVTREVQPVPWVGQDRGPIVMIDPGHGGFDPGTESAGGIAEKTIALAIARRLATVLEARGIRAELTRDDDRFVSLGERTDLANRAQADLFVSIHLNSSPDWNTSGVETYYLNNTTDRSTIRLARMENGATYSPFRQSNLNYILTNLRQDYKAHESSSLARMIETEVSTSVEATLGTSVRALGAKMGPFYVLVGAEMPSVLVECGFLSNPRETQLLIQPGYQAVLAEGIAAAIMNYFNPDARVGNL